MTRISEEWLTQPATQAVCAALTDGGARALFVGGCVRNALLGVPVTDIDITTDARPERVVELAEAAGIKAVPTGIEHGTVTLVKQGIGFEVTTFRRDVETDGRRAVVAFSDRIEEDASRRDFTMNALYAQPDGTVLDPLNGLPDLTARRVRFIGTAENRIREDYLRSLRYFRFHAWYGNADAGFDPDALAAISANLEGLDRLSRERVGAELLKLLAAPNPAPSVATMRNCGVLAHILPGADDRALPLLIHAEAEAPANAIRRLAALGDAQTAESLRLSKAQVARLTRIREAAQGPMKPGEVGFRLGIEEGRDALMLRSAFFEQPYDKSVEPQLARGAKAVFPVKANDLMPAYSGKALGARLKALETLWIGSEFSLSRADLLARKE